MPGPASPHAGPGTAPSARPLGHPGGRAALSTPTRKELPLSAHTRDLLTTAQVAARFGVHPETVTRWARTGKLTSTRTPGGHRRFSRAEVERMTQTHLSTSDPE